MAIFVSYCSADQKKIAPLLGQLARLKREVFIETKSLNGGVAWSAIFNTIQASEAFIFVLTPQTLMSEARRMEYEYASALNKPILVTALDEITEPVTDGKIGYINVSKAIDFQALGEVETSTLIGGLDTLPKEQPPATPPPQPDFMRPFTALKDQVQQVRLPFKDQPRIVFNLREFLERKETNKQAAALLKILNKHTSRSVESAEEITRILDDIDEDERKPSGSFNAARIAIILIVAAALLTLGIMVVRGIPALLDQSRIIMTATSDAPTVEETAAPTLDATLTTPDPTMALIIQQTQSVVASELARVATQADATLRAVHTATVTATATPTRSATQTIAPSSTPAS
jgi:hypothetical protein